MALTPQQAAARMKMRARAAQNSQPSDATGKATPGANVVEQPSGGALDTVKQLLGNTFPGAVYGAVKTMAEGKPAESLIGQTVAGGVKGLSNTAAGLRQVANKVQGDEEELAQLQAGEKERKAKYDALVGDKYFGIPGKVGEIGAAAAPGLLVPGAGAAPLLARLGIGGAAGAAGGYATPVEKESERETNALIGGGLGLLFPAGQGAIAGGRELFRQGSRKLPTEAATALAERMGYAGQKLPLAKALRSSVKGAKDAVKKKFDTAYATVEKQFLPKVELSETNTSLSTLTDLSDQVSESTSPQLARLFGRIREATDPQVKKILDPVTGKPMTSTPTFSFEDTRNTRRELLALSRRFRKSGKEVEANRVSSVIDKIDEDLAAWEKNIGTDAATKAREIDVQYEGEMMPFKRAKLGSYLKSDVSDAKGVTQSGEVIQDLISNAPSATGPVRGLVASRFGDGSTATRASALTSEASEAVMTKEEQQYARQLAQALREAPPSEFEKIIKRIPFTKEKIARILAGVEEMGYTAAVKPSSLRAGVASAGLGNVNYED